MHYDSLNLNNPTVVTTDPDGIAMVSVSTSEPNALTFYLAKENDDQLRQIGGRSVTLRWDPQTDEMDDEWMTLIFELLRGPLES